MVGKFRCAVALAGALLAFSLQAEAAEVAPSIIVYGNTNATGDNLTIKQATANLATVGYDDRISSVVVVSGSWELCTDKDYKGKCTTLGQGLHNLDATMNNLVSSLRPANVAQGAVLLFLDKDGGGKSLRATGEIKKLSDFAGFASAVSSVAIFSGTWEFCKKNDFKGNCTTLGPGVYNLESYNNAVNSLRPK